ncbi:CheY-like chemotaxis protein [Flavobacterium sp. 28A]|uniref:response regulator n=1 Tax=Flavobacterium sp. 28A TaxID=2735895 RepID=UPI00156D7217|nr:response regulator [Flavobacterium sp. 28A]NRT14867.1 CheY-like chemotaxis protein [Flavobacterium sp. 28A]
MDKIKIFYADDDEDDLMFFNDAVEQISQAINTPINLDTFKNGINLIENIKKNDVKNSMLLLDINMPFKSGFDLLEEIRQDPELNHFPIVMYSTSSEEYIINKCQNLGANHYVIKPADFTDLVALITSFVNTDWENHQVDFNNFFYV